MVGRDAVCRSDGQQLCHDLGGIAGAGANLDAPLPQRRKEFRGAGDGVGVPLDALHLARQEEVVEPVDVCVGWRGAEAGKPERMHPRHGEDGLDVGPLGHAHRHPGLRLGDLDALCREGGHKDGDRGAAAMVNNGAGPVEADKVDLHSESCAAVAARSVAAKKKKRAAAKATTPVAESSRLKSARKPAGETPLKKRSRPVCTTTAPR